MDLPRAAWFSLSSQVSSFFIHSFLRFILFWRDGDGSITNTWHTESGVSFVDKFREIEDIEKATVNKTGLGSTNSVVLWNYFQAKITSLSFTAAEWEKEELVQNNGSWSIFNIQEKSRSLYWVRLQDNVSLMISCHYSNTDQESELTFEKWLWSNFPTDNSI